LRSYKLSPSELSFLSIFRTFRVESLWTEVRKDGGDRIAAFVYIPSGRPADFVFSCRLTRIAPVYELIPLSENQFIFGVKNRKGEILRTVVDREFLIETINEDFDREFLKERFKKSICIAGRMLTYFPPTYNPFSAKRLYSFLHTQAKRDAYLFDIDVALVERNGEDFIYLIEYKSGREFLYRKDILTYNERIGYRFLSREYRTLLVVGERSFSVYDFNGDSEELIDNVKRENLETFLLELQKEMLTA